MIEAWLYTHSIVLYKKPYTQLGWRNINLNYCRYTQKHIFNSIEKHQIYTIFFMIYSVLNTFKVSKPINELSKFWMNNKYTYQNKIKYSQHNLRGVMVSKRWIFIYIQFEFFFLKTTHTHQAHLHAFWNKNYYTVQ